MIPHLLVVHFLHFLQYGSRFNRAAIIAFKKRSKENNVRNLVRKIWLFAIHTNLKTVNWRTKHNFGPFPEGSEKESAIKERNYLTYRTTTRYYRSRPFLFPPYQSLLLQWSGIHPFSTFHHTYLTGTGVKVK